MIAMHLQNNTKHSFVYENFINVCKYSVRTHLWTHILKKCVLRFFILNCTKLSTEAILKIIIISFE